MDEASLELIEELLSHGSDPSLQNKEGSTALSIAKKRGPEVTDLIEKYSSAKPYRMGNST
jgi:ankyrin repeat protein